MAELIFQHRRHMAGSGGREYNIKVVGAPNADAWVAVLEFHPLSGGLILRTEEETTQPSRDSLVRWASALDDVDLEGAFERAFDHASRGTK